MAALTRPLQIRHPLARREVPLLLVTSVLYAFMALNGRISRAEGGMLIGCLGLHMRMRYLRRTNADARDPCRAPAVETPEASPEHWAPAVHGAIALVGLLLLLLSAQISINSAVALAHVFGMSDGVIGLSLVAGGTSLRELATAVVAARRGEHDLVLGSIVGSNLYNRLTIVGLVALVWTLLVAPPGCCGRSR